MGQESDKEPELKIVDRRRFSAEGDTVSDKTGTDTSGPAKSAAPPKPETKVPAKEPPPAKPADPRGEPMSQEQSGSSRVDFASFIMSLATQTLVMLGEIPNPETNLSAMNLGAARQTIDILDMLEQKTRGNLSTEEKQLITELLSSLRMVFVEKVRGSADLKKGV